MKYHKSGADYVVVLAKGDELMAGLKRFAAETVTQAAWLQGLGAALEAELGYYDLKKKEYVWKSYGGPLEVTNLTGNIAQKDGQPLLHVHGTLAADNYRAIGGHVKKLVAGGTIEILVRPLDAELTRRRDEATGLDLLTAAGE